MCSSSFMHCTLETVSEISPSVTDNPTTLSPKKNTQSENTSHMTNGGRTSDNTWKQLVNIEKRRLAVEKERLAIERERLALERYSVTLQAHRCG